MKILILAVSIYTNCLNCVNGYIQVPCDNCNGTGYPSLFVRQRFRGKSIPVPCKKCYRGLYSLDKPGTGKIKKKCPICKGKKKLKTRLTK